jgi:hypothetical protein
MTGLPKGDHRSAPDKQQAVLLSDPRVGVEAAPKPIIINAHDVIKGLQALGGQLLPDPDAHAQPPVAGAESPVFARDLPTRTVGSSSQCRAEQPPRSQ